MEDSKKQVSIPEIITVKQFAEKADLPVTTVITELMKNGVLATINETIDYDTASIVGEYLGVAVVPLVEEAESNKTKISKKDKKSLVLRPPVVTVMGHVDHGKTSLLDKIRQTHIVEGESGGITQHISAYQVEIKNAKNKNIKNKLITFIDTPGHAAFSAMRAHGTAITDIVVLIVAANDGVKPQTVEVIKQAKVSNVPIIVAINKVDLPDADVMKVKQQLAEHELSPEEWGGKTIMVEVSAKTGQGIDDLLEMILLQAEMMELKASPKESAVGVVIESHMHKGAGPMAIVLIENGTIHKGDPVSIGSACGKARILEDFAKHSIEQAGPSTPVRIAGLKTLPEFGDHLVAFCSEKEARENSQMMHSTKSELKIATAKKIKSEESDEEKEQIEFNLIVKADVHGSLEALKSSIGEIQSEEILLRIVSEGVGAISESEVTLAKATHSQVVGFRIQALGAAKRMAEKDNVKIKVFDVIYELIDYIKSEMSDLLPPEIIEEEQGHGKVLQIFRDDKKGFVAGGSVESGKISNGSEIKILQDKNEKYRAKIVSLRREKNEVKECESGSECGFGLPAGANVAVGDTFIVFQTIRKKRQIV
jgi:translation initiation factor IF-2